MRKNSFYFRLALTNISKNGRFYLPYILACIGTIAMFYIMCFIATNQGVDALPGASSLQHILNFGTIVVGLFAAVFLFYTNSFLMKRRQQELGLYSVLGMEKQHIARVLSWETDIVAVISLAFGIEIGILLSKLLLLLLYKLLNFSAPFGFTVSGLSLAVTTGLFAVIFLLTLRFNLRQIKLASPIELLRGARRGEREPRTKKALAAIGLLALAAGYTIALTTHDPLSAFGLFFIAVVLVIIGTYCLFTAGSIAALKRLRRNRRFYYQTRHFTAIAGMIYRMKQNAVGLASICVLATMVLVMLSTTVALYGGLEDSIELVYPRDVQIYLIECDEGAGEILASSLTEAAESIDLAVSNVTWFYYYQGEDEWNRWLHMGDKLKQAQAQPGSIVGANGQDYRPNLYFGFDSEEDGEYTVRELSFMGFLASPELRGRYDTAVIGRKDVGIKEVYAAYGGFLFLGLLLGSLFMMATVLIIYYKQISEGYDDRQRFAIMQQVGLSREEIKATIRSQILMVFFLPIVMAIIHVAAAFPMITKLLALLNLTDIPLFIGCTVITVLAFCALYGAIYALTARTYYRIVS